MQSIGRVLIILVVVIAAGFGVSLLVLPSTAAKSQGFDVAMAPQSVIARLSTAAPNTVVGAGVTQSGRPTVTNNVVLYTALFDVDNPNKQLMAQMTAQVFFVRASAHDAVTLPVAALHFTGGRGGVARGDGGTPGAAAQGARAGRNGAGRRGGRAGQDGEVAQFDQGGAPRARPATVTVVKDDGTQETRDVTVGVSDRVNAQVVSGLSEGEMVVVGTDVAPANGARTAQRPNVPRPPGLPGVGFGGIR